MAWEVVKLRLVFVFGAIVSKDVQVEPVGWIDSRVVLLEHTSHNEKPIGAPLDLLPLTVGWEDFLSFLECVEMIPKHIDKSFWWNSGRVHVEGELHHQNRYHICVFSQLEEGCQFCVRFFVLDVFVATFEDLDALFVVLGRDQRVQTMLQVEAGLVLARKHILLLLFDAFLFFLVVLINEVLDSLREVQFFVCAQTVQVSLQEVIVGLDVLFVAAGLVELLFALVEHEVLRLLLRQEEDHDVSTLGGEAGLPLGGVLPDPIDHFSLD